ncbi:MAG: hypothetical protein QM767_10630 [Anaeromyxobacter sp.]
MKRLATLIAATVLGSGCIVSDTTEPCDSSITIQWPNFRLAEGTITGGSMAAQCAQAGVDFVNVYFDGAPVLDGNGNPYDFLCSDGGAFIYGVYPGTHLVTVEGIDTTGWIVNRGEFSYGAPTCGSPVQNVQPGEGFVSVGYAFAPDNVCWSDHSYMWFALYDETVGATTVSIDTNNTDLEKRSYLCGDPAGIVFRMPQGGYTMQRMEEWDRVGSNAYTVTGKNCTDQHFDVYGGSSSDVNVVLQDAGGVACQ